MISSRSGKDEGFIMTSSKLPKPRCKGGLDGLYLLNFHVNIISLNLRIMRKQIVYFALVFVFGIFTQHAVDAQVAVTPKSDRVTGKAVEARPSPMAVATLKDGDTYVKVVYNQPHLKGRKMIGDQEPYGKVWRLGANEATEITLTEGITVGGKELAAGTYSMFAIPNEDQWTIIFNSGLGQWGAYSYDESLDVLRVDVPVTKADKTYEPFTIWFSEDGSSMNMAWGETLVAVPIKLQST